jgi:starvation-inducible DNA-binding protein
MGTTREWEAMTEVAFVPAGFERDGAEAVVELLQGRLVGLIDLALTLKHVHWNVVGPHFIGVHRMLDPQAERVNEFIDAIAERITAMGGSPNGLPGRLVAQREWDDYALGRDVVDAHLAALDQVYVGIITSHRDGVARAGELDPVTEDMLIGQTGELELFHWFVRAHLEDSEGRLVSDGATTERGAADATRNAQGNGPSSTR